MMRKRGPQKRAVKHAEQAKQRKAAASGSAATFAALAADLSRLTSMDDMLFGLLATPWGDFTQTHATVDDAITAAKEAGSSAPEPGTAQFGRQYPPASVHTPGTRRPEQRKTSRSLRGKPVAVPGSARALAEKALLPCGAGRAACARPGSQSCPGPPGLPVRRRGWKKQPVCLAAVMVAAGLSAPAGMCG